MTVYQEVRAAGKSMHLKCLAATQNLGFDPVHIAKAMGVRTAGKTIIFDDEVAEYGFFDFWFHEFRVNGRTLIQHVDLQAAGLTPLEAEMLDARRRAPPTSLFQVLEALPRIYQVRLHDLLDPQRPDICLTDMGMSQSLSQMGTADYANFCRIVHVRDLAMTSGFTFQFPTERVPGLLQAYHQKAKRVTPENLSAWRFAFFYQKYLQCGLETVFQDVV